MGLDFRDRYLKPVIGTFLSKQVVFVGGPRQAGKTTLCLQFLKQASPESPAYLNWDVLKDRQAIKAGEISPDEPVVCLDEVHKFRPWRSLVKGLYDTKGHRQRFLVTGSARLDHYRRGGDSLLGRYRYLRLHPFSLGELSFDRETTERLLKFGGFPGVFLDGTEERLRLWHQERTYRLVHDDVRDLQQVRKIDSIELLADALAGKVGSLLSVKKLADQLEENHKTVGTWLTILDNLYYSYRIAPWVEPKIRAVKKERKLYLWDWSAVPDPAVRFENMVGSHLLKHCHLLEDAEGWRMELRYIRDVQKREIDFVVLKDAKPLFAVECKSGDRSPSPNIRYFKERTGIPKFYQVHLGEKHFEPDRKTVVVPFWRFCQDLGLP